MALSEFDRSLIQRCLVHKPKAWQEFVDRFMGLVLHVINHTAQCRSIRLPPEDREDLAAEVFVTIVKDQFAVLRNFRGESSLATYLTVVARRVVVHELLRRKPSTPLAESLEEAAASGNGPEARSDDREEVERLLGGLAGTEAVVVRMYHLEGKSYREISDATGLAENSVGPTLSRARIKMRRAATNPPTSNPQ